MERKPAGWGTEKLAEFIDNTRSNVFASFHSLPASYKKLLDIEGAFRLIGENLLNPAHLSDAFFVLKTHSSYLGSAHLALCGQVPEAFMLMRGTLESAMYALYINKNTNAAKVWIDRHDSPEARKVCRNEFTAGNLMGCLKSIDAPLRETVSTLYERTIDLGAHPNVASLAMMLTVSDSDTGKNFKLKYLTNDVEAINVAVRSAAHVGVCALLILRHVFPQRFDLLGITAQLPGLQAGL